MVLVQKPSKILSKRIVFTRNAAPGSGKRVVLSGKVMGWSRVGGQNAGLGAVRRRANAWGTSSDGSSSCAIIDHSMALHPHPDE